MIQFRHISSTYRLPAVPQDFTLPNNLPLENTVSILTAFAFADDAKQDRNSLLRVKKFLEDFGALSGLECNVEKTTVMCVNSDIPEYINEVGFSVVQSVTIFSGWK